MSAPSHLRLAAAPTELGARALPAIRVVVGDDHTLVRRGRRLLLEREADVELVAEAGDVVSTMRNVYGHRPHVLVLDLTVPDGSSLDTIERLRQQAPETEIVVLAMEDDP